MNISGRLSKIEEQLSSNNPQTRFCTCWKKHLNSAIVEVYDAYNTGREEDESKIHPAPNFEAGFCDLCKKTISKDDIQLAKDFELISQMYDDIDL